MKRTGFTLIELLIVVAIIAILAAIAVPNFLEAQTRAKVSRSKADLRSISIALEAYAVDYSDYPPNDGAYTVTPNQISTPVAFITNARLVDPFASNEFANIPGIDPALERFYTYQHIVTLDEFVASSIAGVPIPSEAVDFMFMNSGAFKKYGKWRQLGHGPDRSYPDLNFVPGSDPDDPNNVLKGSDVVYDSTNGTLSKGNILKTQLGRLDRW